MTIIVNGTQLHVVRATTGNAADRLPSIVMHGGLGWDHTYLPRWLDPLSDILDLVYYDHHGNGRSARPVDWSTISHRTWVEDAEALRTLLGYERVLLFGHSYGSFLALEYALEYPERLAGLVLCSTAPVLDFFEVALAKARARATDAQFCALVNAMGSAPPQNDHDMHEGSQSVLPIYLHDPQSPLAQTLLRDVHYCRDAFVHGMSCCLPHYDLRTQLNRIAVPTLVLSGAHDWLTPPALGGERVRAEITGAEHVVFANSGHFPFAEESEAFQHVLRDWLARAALLPPRRDPLQP